MSKLKNTPVANSHHLNQGQDSLLGLFARIFWSLIGNIVLFFLTIELYRSQSVFSYFDLGFWATVLSLIIVRYLDIKYLKGVNVEGLPATMQHWWKYVKYLLFVSATVWIAAKLLGPVF